MVSDEEATADAVRTRITKTDGGEEIVSDHVKLVLARIRGEWKIACVERPAGDAK